MKIAILTQALHNNCGGYLQNYALQQVLRSLGHEVETLDWDYFRSKQEPTKPFLFLFDTGKVLLSRILLGRKTNFSWVRKDIYHSLARNNRQFANEHMNVSPYLWGKRQFRRYAENKGIDVFIVGSDQVWRPAYNSRGMLYRMFLDFTKGMNVKRIAYAASFGTEKWEFSDRETKKCSRLIKCFNTVSVRELGGVELCRDYLGVIPTHVIDPTMILKQKDYLQLINDVPSPVNGKYVLSYILDSNVTIEQAVGHFCSSIDSQSYSILPKKCNLFKQNRNNLEEFLYPSVTSWLNAIYHSEFVICDSFHGVVFSIIFNKPFAVIVNSNRGVSRFTSILSMFELKDRIVTDFDKGLNLLYSKPIDWEKVNKILSSQRDFSLSFLADSLIPVLK